MSFREQLRTIADDFFESTERETASSHDIASWAIRNNRWRPQPADLTDQCAKQIAVAMREDFITDPQGRRVRAKYAARLSDGKRQQTLWGDIRSASKDHMKVAFQQRRHQIVGDCRQLKADVDSFNDNRVPEQPIQMSFDFTLDLEELEAAARL